MRSETRRPAWSGPARKRASGNAGSPERDGSAGWSRRGAPADRAAAGERRTTAPAPARFRGTATPPRVGENRSLCSWFDRPDLVADLAQQGQRFVRQRVGRLRSFVMTGAAHLAVE